MWESKVAPLSGLVFVLLVVASTLIIDSYEFMPAEEEIASFYAGDSVRIMSGAYVGTLAAFFLLWFSGSVKKAIDRANGDPGASDRIATVAFGGGVFAAAMMTIGYLATTAGAERALLHEGIDPGAAATLSDLSSLVVGTGAAFGFAALIAGVAVSGFRSGAFPRWLTWSSAVIALGLLSPVNWIVIGLGVLWVPVVSVLLYRRANAHRETEARVSETVG